MAEVQLRELWRTVTDAQESAANRKKKLQTVRRVHATQFNVTRFACGAAHTLRTARVSVRWLCTTHRPGTANA